jgi:hypothetical protein
VSFDNLATNEQSSSFHIRGGFCGSELFHLSYDHRLGRGVIQSQRHRLYLDRNTHLPSADALRLLPREQQLHAEFGRLLWMPPGGFPEHHIDWRERAQSRHSGIPHDGRAVRIVPPDYDMGCWSLRSHDDRLPADE